MVVLDFFVGIVQLIQLVQKTDTVLVDRNRELAIQQFANIVDIIDSVAEIWTAFDDFDRRIDGWIGFVSFDTISIAIDLDTTVDVSRRISEYTQFHNHRTLHVFYYQQPTSHHQLALSIELIVPIVLATHILHIIDFYLVEITGTFVQF